MEFSNITYSHEHIVIDLTAGKNNPDCYLNYLEEAVDEIKYLYALGVRTIVDCSNHGMGVDWDVNKKIEELTGVRIVNSTGFYKDPFLPENFEFLSVNDLADIMIKDIENGAQIIGEIGTSKNVMTNNERKLFEAACIAQKETNAVIITHTTLGTYALEQMNFFKERGINLSKVVISHVALADNFDMILELVKNGANVAFDTIGKLNYLDDETRIKFIKQLCQLGYTKQILMSMDLTRQSHLKKNGGNGLAYLIEKFIPRCLEAGIKEVDIKTILCENFERIIIR